MATRAPRGHGSHSGGSSFRRRTGSSPTRAQVPAGTAARRQVIESGDGFEAICGDTPVRCKSLRLSADEVIVHKLDVEAFGGQLSRLLGIERFSLSETGIEQTWGLGGYGPLASEAVPVYFTVPTGRDAFRRAVTELLALAEGPFVLLAPTSKVATLPTLEKLRRREAVFAALDDLLEVNDAGGISACRVLADLMPNARKPGGRSHQSTNIIRREGSLWVLRFAGKTAHLRNSVGLGYLAALLREPGREFHTAQLAALEKAPGKPLPFGDSGDLLDRKALGAYQSRVAEITSELDEATAFNDLGRKARLQEELDAIASELLGATGLGGRRRRATNDADRVRKSVGNALSRAIVSIRKVHPELAAHLEGSVRLGAFVSYETGGATTWLT